MRKYAKILNGWNMEIKRDIYLQQLIAKKNNGLIKIITGIRRCGKSYLLFKLFKKHLINEGIKESHIIQLALDDYANKKYRDSDELYNFVKKQIQDNSTYYILLDEVQYVADFEDVLNGFMHIQNADVYVTGSNSKFLSTDIITEFRGRGDEIRVYPLSFNEFKECTNDDDNIALKEYLYYGGLPLVKTTVSIDDKVKYLSTVFKKVYMSDLIERYGIKNESEFEDLVRILASSIGSLTNPNKLSNTFKSVKRTDVSANTLKKYIGYLEDAFVIDGAIRYDIKGKKYISTPHKYYFTDLGLRNSILDFRQQEETHLMENLIYNELRIRGYNVDVGVVEINGKDEYGKSYRKQLEIDFIASKGYEKYYIQSAYAIPDEKKMNQEKASLIKVDDSFEKIIISKDLLMPYKSDDGIHFIGLMDFLKAKSTIY